MLLNIVTVARSRVDHTLTNAAIENRNSDDSTNLPGIIERTKMPRGDIEHLGAGSSLETFVAEDFQNSLQVRQPELLIVAFVPSSVAGVRLATDVDVFQRFAIAVIATITETEAGHLGVRLTRE